MTVPVPSYISSFDLCMPPEGSHRFHASLWKAYKQLRRRHSVTLPASATQARPSFDTLTDSLGAMGQNTGIWISAAEATGGERPLKSRQLRRCAQLKFSAHVCFNPICMLLCLTSLHKLSMWSLTYVIWPCICFFPHNPLDLRVLWTTICWLQLSTVLVCHFYSFCSNGALTFVQFDEGNHLQKPGFGHLKSAVTWSGC